MRRLVLLPLLTLLAACGDDPQERLSLGTPPERSSAAPLPQAQRAEQRAAREARARSTQRDAERLRPVLRGWGEALRRDRSRAAARYFAVPAVVAQGSELTLTSAAQVMRFNDAFPCGARLLHVQTEGRYVIGTFELTPRPTRDCEARGDVLRVAFTLRKRKIAEWRELAQPLETEEAARADARAAAAGGRLVRLAVAHDGALRAAAVLAEEEQRDHEPQGAHDHQDQPDGRDLEPETSAVTAK